MTIETAADYYGVPVKTIETIVKRNKGELKKDKLKVLKGEKLKRFKGYCQDDENLLNATKYAPFLSRALLRISKESLWI